jgi:hypothetical protein
MEEKIQEEKRPSLTTIALGVILIVFITLIVKWIVPMAVDMIFNILPPMVSPY